MTDLKMSKVLGAAALASLALALPAFAQDAAAPAAAAAAEVTPIIDKGDTAWMLVSTMVVFVMIFMVQVSVTGPRQRSCR